jgi:diketogulonate reductase-like aldo/keto reductase
VRNRRFGPLAIEPAGSDRAGPASASIQVPVIGLGTWNMERDDRKSAIAAIRRGLELGLTHVDTAEMYGGGRVESLVAEAIAEQRERVFLVSKVLPGNASYAGTIAACEASLKRLATDHLDCYLLHWPGDHPLDDTIRAFESLRASGKIRAWGVSNFDEDELAQALAIAGPGKIACNQVLYHLGDRTIEHRVIPWCAEHGVAVVAYSPFGSRGGFPRSKPLEQLAAARGAHPRQVALAFLTRWPNAFAIPKSSQVAHVEQLAREVTLDDAAIAALDRAFPLGEWRGLPSL